MACMDDLQNISGLSFRQRHQHPFVNDEQVVLLQLSNALLEGALSSGNSQVLQQFRQPHVFHDKGGSHFPECWLSTAGHPALTGQNIQGCLYCWLTSFGRSLQTNLRITLDGTVAVSFDAYFITTYNYYFLVKIWSRKNKNPATPCNARDCGINTIIPIR